MKALAVLALVLFTPMSGVTTPPSEPEGSGSVRFFGTGPTWGGDEYVDRVRVLVDDGAAGAPVLPANIGGEDFTIELWLRASTANDNEGFGSGAHNLWILGNIFVDRDRWANAPNEGLDFGISLADGNVQFGVENADGDQYTLVGTSDIRGTAWVHVAVTRVLSSGVMSVYVNGAREATVTGPTGTLAYPDDITIETHCGEFGSDPCTESDPYFVLGAEKHDAADDLSYIGEMDEIRLSNSLRYTGSSYTVPTAPFETDSNTMWLWHADEGSGTTATDASGNGNNGSLEVGGPSAAPQWSMETPF